MEQLGGLFILGIMVGAIGALMGIGGGLLIVPFFLYVMGYSVQQTVGTAMVIVFFNALSGTIAYIQQDKIYLPAAWRFGLATIPGAVLGGWASQYFSGVGFQLAFGLFLILVAGNMCLNVLMTGEEKADDEVLSFQGLKLGTVCSVFVGFLSSALGIGGGVIHVPMMNQVLKYPIHVAIATSTCILLISSVSGLAIHGFMGHILLGPALSTGLGALAGARLGVKLAGQMAPGRLKLAFSGFVFIMGMKFVSSTML